MDLRILRPEQHLHGHVQQVRARARERARVTTGWSGGVANRTWRRDGNDGSGRIGLIEDVRRILGKFRDEHGYEPGQVWDPYAGAYVWPEEAMF